MSDNVKKKASLFIEEREKKRYRHIENIKKEQTISS
jgi:hypothetical protein